MLPAQEKKKRDDDRLLEGVGLVNVQPVTKIEANVRAVLGQRGLKPKVWAVVAPEVALLVALAAALIANGRLDGGGGQRLALAVVNPVGNLAADGAVGRRGLEQGLLPLVEVGKVLRRVVEHGRRALSFTCRSVNDAIDVRRNLTSPLRVGVVVVQCRLLRRQLLRALLLHPPVPIRYDFF